MKSRLKTQGLIFVAVSVPVLAFIASEMSNKAYAAAAVPQAMTSTFLVGPSLAAWAAWRASVLVRGGVHDLAPARPVLRVLTRELMPILGTGLAILALAAGWAVVSALASQLAGSPSLAIKTVAMSVAVISGHAVLGYGVGTRLPAVIAVPSVLVVLYLWMVFPPAWEPLWLRHLNGWMSGSGCCYEFAGWHPGALVAPILVAAGFVVAGLFLAARAGWQKALMGAGLAISLTMLASASLVWRLDADESRPRPASALVCAQGELAVCLWPAHTDRATEVADMARQIRDALEPWGITVPGRITEAQDPAAGEPEWLISLHPFLEPHQVYTNLLGVLVPALPLNRPPEGAGAPGYPAGCPRWSDDREPEELLLAWLGVQTGFFEGPPEWLSEQDTAELDTVLSRPWDEQRAWYQKSHAALAACAPALEDPRYS